MEFKRFCQVRIGSAKHPAVLHEIISSLDATTNKVNAFALVELPDGILYHVPMYKVKLLDNVYSEDFKNIQKILDAPVVRIFHEDLDDLHCCQGCGNYTNGKCRITHDVAEESNSDLFRPGDSEDDPDNCTWGFCLHDTGNFQY